MKQNLAEDIWSMEEIMRRQYPDITDAAVNAVQQASNRWECRKGEAIVKQGEQCDKWIFVSKGLHRVMFTKNGKDDTLFFDGGGAIFTSFHSLITNEGSIFRVEALTDSMGWEISNHKYSLLQSRYPDLLRFEIGLHRHQFYSLEDYYRRRALSTPQERYDEFWNERKEKLKYLAPHILSRFIPLKVIAQYLSMTPQMLSILRRRELENNRRKNMNNED